MLTHAQRKTFLKFPDLDEGTLHLHYTLSQQELGWVMEKQGDASRLGYAVHLKIMQHLVRDPESLEIPADVIQHVAAQLQLPTSLYQDYRAGKQVTIKQHRQELKRKLGLTSCNQLELYRDFSAFLKPHALQLCAGFPLMALLVDEMRNRKVIWSKIGPLEMTVHQLLDWTEKHTQDLLLAGLSEDGQRQIENLLRPHKGSDDTEYHLLGWFREKHLDANPKSITSLLDKLHFLRQMGLPWEALKLIPRSRQEAMFRESRFLHAQQLRQMEKRKRWATSLMILMDVTVQITDQVVDLHAKIMQAQLRNCRNKYLEDLQDTQLGLADALAIHQKVGRVLIEARKQGEDPFKAIDQVVEWDTYVKSVEAVTELTSQTEFDSLSLMAGRLEHFHQYSGKLLSHFRFGATAADTPFLDAIEVVKELSKDPDMQVRETAPLDFVAGRWSKFVVQDGKVNPAYYELCLLDTLTRKLHAGDIHLERSRKYRHFEDYLLPIETWRAHLKQHPLMVAGDFSAYWEDQMKRLSTQLSEVDLKLGQDELQDVRMEAGKVVVSRNRRDITVSGKAKRLGKRLYGMIPTIKITDIMLEVDTWTLYQKHFKHFALSKTIEDVQELYSVILAEGTNLSLRKMAHATNPVNFKRLALVRECFVREETFRAAQAELVNFHTRLPIAQL
ncbi:hypothetical protein GCM10008938_36950 [Deinococcus roseus]|uniref:DDE transposase n=1 Tax=Deinococcus roseus TaxID=392414 RepID=A0ABQ2D8U4_9DEIO|nr:hypothetical protein GCM10008938_36950 [Deinococcus roseus]